MKTLDEFINELIEIRDSGRALSRAQVVFITKKGNAKPILRIAINTPANNQFSNRPDRIELKS